MSDDERLREAFRHLRREEAQSAPEFDHLIARARARGSEDPGSSRGSWRWLLAFVATGMASLLVYTSIRESGPAAPSGRAPKPDAELAIELDRWVMPTDVLLDLPGNELLGRLPEIGSSPQQPFDPMSPDSVRRTL